MSAKQETATAADAESKHTPVGAVCAGILAPILSILLIFPGFLAGILSRSGGGVYVIGNVSAIWYFDDDPENPAVEFAAKIVLLPSRVLMHQSAVIQRFYVWQFTKAGGGIVSLDYEP